MPVKNVRTVHTGNKKQVAVTYRAKIKSPDTKSLEFAQLRRKCSFSLRVSREMWLEKSNRYTMMDMVSKMAKGAICLAE